MSVTACPRLARSMEAQLPAGPPPTMAICIKHSFLSAVYLSREVADD
jgi:hypothetical protein